jgi:hypothetical protein
VSRAKQPSISRCTASGSSRSDTAVKPAMSANRTVTCFRSPSSALRAVRIFSAKCFGV